MRRQLRFLFQEPGMLEAIAITPGQQLTGTAAQSRGYGDSGIPDLLVDYRLKSDQPFAWISYNFHRTYPVVIWGLRLFMSDERFDVPQAGLTNVPLYEAFSWAYKHFILEDTLPDQGEKANLTQQVLSYSLSTIG